MFAPLPDPDHPALELEILERWERRADVRAAARAEPRRPSLELRRRPGDREQDASRVHTAWGRTLKDVFQRYKALRGFDQRYQNGFDCQGLWIEVGVERELGLNSKREIEEYGLAEFARKCREKVVWSASELTRGLEAPRPVDGLGQRLLHVLATRTSSTSGGSSSSCTSEGWLYLGHRSTEWCPRCGTSHLRSTSSRRATLPGASRPVAVRPLPAARPAGRVARRLDDDAVDAARERRRGRQARRRVRAARERRVGRASRAIPDEKFAAARARRGARRALATRARSTTCPRPPESSTGSSRGTRSRSTRAPGSSTSRRAAAPRTSSSRASTTCPCSRPSTRRAASTTTSAGCTGSGPPRRPSRSSATSRERGLLVEAGEIEHRFPFCWRCHTPLIFRDRRRLVHRGRRAPPAAARRERDGRVDARVHGQAHGRLAAEHGRLEHLAPPLLRPAAAVLPVRVRPPDRHRVEAELEERAIGGLDQLEELRRPWIDDVPIRCEACGEEVRADPRGRRRLARRRASSRSRRSAGRARSGSPEGYATGAANGLTARRPSRPRLLGAVVPGRLGLRDARADPPLVLLAALHVGRARRPRAVPAGARLREDARRARPGDARLVGEHDRRRGRVRAHGRRRHALAVLRAAARPQPALRLRAGARDQAAAAHALELGRRSSSTTGTSRAPAELRRPRERAVAASCSRSTAGSWRGRSSSSREATAGVRDAGSRATSMRAFEAFVDDVSNWYIRRSRRRFWDGDEAALRDALVRARPGAARRSRR